MRVLRRLIGILRWRSRDDDMTREMAFHVDSLARDYIKTGMNESDARREAQRRFGNALVIRERGHDVRGIRWVEDIVRDVTFAVRGLARTPGFAVAVIATLALGIGANVAIFSIADRMLLRPLPYPNGELLTVVREQFVGQPPNPSASPANWLDWQRESRTFESLAAWTPFNVTLIGINEPVRVSSQAVSVEFFHVLGVKPLLGRVLSAEDDRPDAPRVVVLSHQTWQRHFGGARDVIGRSIRLSDVQVEIVGVMPDGFRFVDPDVGLWAAFRLDRNRHWRQTAGRFIHVVGRLAPGTTIETARAEMEGIAQRLADAHVFNRNTSVHLTPLREELTGEVSSSVLALYAAVGALLAIACFNATSLASEWRSGHRHAVSWAPSLPTDCNSWALARSSGSSALSSCFA